MHVISTASLLSVTSAHKALHGDLVAQRSSIVAILSNAMRPEEHTLVHVELTADDVDGVLAKMEASQLGVGNSIENAALATINGAVGPYKQHLNSVVACVADVDVDQAGLIAMKAQYLIVRKSISQLERRLLPKLL